MRAALSGTTAVALLLAVAVSGRTPALADAAAPSAPGSVKPAPTASSSASAAPAAAPAKWSDQEGFPPVTSDDPVWGDRAAPVTVVVFSDYQCPFCGNLDGTIADLKKKYGAHRLRVVHKHMPLDMHKDARPAAIAAETVRILGGSDAFFQFSERAFADPKNLTNANFNAFARAAGVDTKAITKELVERATKKVDEDIAEAKAAGVTGTPTSFVNGVRVGGAAKVDAFSTIIDEELKKAAKLGVRADKKYVLLSRQAKLAADAEKRRKGKHKP